MPPGNRRGTRGKCDVIFSKIIRSRGECESCGQSEYRKLQCAHIVSRRYSWTRTYEPNAFCLCWSCHRKFTENPFAWVGFVRGQIGDAYEGLWARANCGEKFDWDAELARLKSAWAELEQAA